MGDVISTIFGKASFLILAGGKSGRMGIDKADLLYRDETFLDHLISKAKKIGFEEILVSGKQIPDLIPDRGPLGGIYSGLLSITKPLCFVISVDLPQISENTIRNMIEQHTNSGKYLITVLNHRGRIEPLIGVFDRSLCETIRKEIEIRPVSVFRLFDIAGFSCYDHTNSENEIRSVNTLEDYEWLIKQDEKAIAEGDRLCMRSY